MILAPSLLAADFGYLAKNIEEVNNSSADWLHIDVMDGCFVPNISFGTPVMEALKHYAKKPLDVHLMIVDPDRYLELFSSFGIEVLTVHYEACTHLHRTIASIKEQGVRAGVALNPHTPVEVLQPIIKDIDLVCLMSVNPGFGGQKFIENTYDKILRLKKLIKDENASALIEIDGGVTLELAPKLLQYDPDVLVVGSSIFKTPEIRKTIEQFKNI